MRKQIWNFAATQIETNSNTFISVYKQDIGPLGISVVPGKGRHKKCFFEDIFPRRVYPPTHPRVFLRFVKQKVKFGSKKAIFGVIWFFLGVWTLFGNQPPHPPTFGKDLPQKKLFFIPSLNIDKYKIYDHTILILMRNTNTR